MNPRMSRHLRGEVVLFIALTWMFRVQVAMADCTLTNLGFTPMNELGFQTYSNFSGGLYPNGANGRPPAHEAAGLQIATNQIVPLDTAGNAKPNTGKIVMLSLGMSITTDEWASGDNATLNITNAFQYRANQDPSKNPQ